MLGARARVRLGKFGVLMALAMLGACTERQPVCEAELEFLVVEAHLLNGRIDRATEANLPDVLAQRAAGSARLIKVLRSCPSAFDKGVAVRGIDGGTLWLPIDLAALTTDHELMAELLARPVDWLEMSERREGFVAGTALHVAASGSSADVVRLLVEYGFDVDRVDGVGDPVLIAAVLNTQNPEVVDELLRSGADPRKSTAGRFTPLEAAIFFGRPEAVRRLLEGGALDGLGPESFSRLMEFAKQHGTPGITKMLGEVAPPP